MDRSQVVSEISSQVFQECISIILTGSMVDDSFSEDSDVDFIVVVSDHDKRKRILKIVKKIQKRTRSLIDCKVYSLEEFNHAKGGQDHFFIWASFKKSRLLHGQDLRQTVHLKPHLVRDILWNLITKLESVTYFLSDEVQFTGSCVTVFTALATSYFVEQFVLESIAPSLTKRQYLRKHLGEVYQAVSKRYQWVRNRVQDTLSIGRFAIPVKVDSLISSQDYVVILDTATKVLNLIKRVERDVAQMIDS